MDLFDMVRAAPPPQHIRDNDLAENEQRSPSPVLPSPGHSTSMSPMVYATSDLEEVNTGSQPAPDAATTADGADEVDTSTADAADEADASTADAADEADASTADAADEADASTADAADEADASTADDADASTADAADEADEADATASATDEESTSNCKRLEVHVKRTTSREYSVPRATSPACSDKQYNLDDDNDLESHSQSQSPQQLQLQQCPPKTKAEQKMFVDALLPAQDDDSFKLKNCFVRLKRLTPQDIAALQSAARAPKKRGRPRNSDAQNSDVSPPKKQLSKVHIRAPWLQNGGKSFIRSPFKTPRSATPPPARSFKLHKSPKLNSSPKAKERAALVKKYGPIYGSRCFNCVVKVKRMYMPFNSPRTPLNQLIRRARKSNLSVSFSDSVEILGSGSSSRGRGKKLPKTPLSVPTRLQRVDAAGNVLEDIELPNHTGLKPTAKCKRRSLGNGCNGGNPNKGTTPGRRGRPSKLKRPAQPLPVTDLASLRIDDEDEDGEFIVPNDLPQCHPISPRRAGTPIPSKRMITTTISDDEVETEPPVEKTPDRVASVRFDADADDNDANKKEEQPGEHGQLKQVTNVQATESVKNSCIANDLPDEDNNKTDTDCQDIDNSDEKEVPGAAEVTEQNVHNTINDTKGVDMSNNDNSNNKVLHEDAADTKTNEAVTKESPAVVDELTSDILEIRTSVEDVRELHTPVSRDSTPRKRLRRSLSANSDVSFKSANDEMETKAETERNGKISDIENVGGLVKTSSTDGELNDSQIYSTPNENSFTAPPHYSPIDEMPNLDEEDLGELGRLVVPDFQLSASANTLPSGNLDDIMTVLES